MTPRATANYRNLQLQQSRRLRVDGFSRDRASAFEPVGVEIGLLLGRRGAAQNRIAMRKAAEAADDVGMALGIFQIFIVGLPIQRDAALLIVHVLRMHERQEEK